MKKLFSYLFLVLSVMLIIVPVSAEASGGTVISTVVPSKYTITFDIEGGGSVTYDGVIYEDGDTIRVTEGTNMTFQIKPYEDCKLKSVSYNGKKVTKQVSDNAITIENVQQDGTLAVTFSKKGSFFTPAYVIKATAGEGGSIMPPGKVTVLYGGNKTFTITPNDGYAIADVKVDGKSVGAVETYTFERVRGDHTIEAVFMKATGNPQTGVDVPFTDVSEKDWFYEDVAYVYANDLMKGTSETTFSPDVTTTRGMIVTILYRLEGEPTVSDTCPFEDVKSGSYYEKAITWAAANEIVSGYGNGKFGPDDAITREQMAVILYRYTQYKGMDVSVGEDTNILSYNDALDISEYAFSAMQWACGESILNGSDGSLMPQGNATRAQVAAILHRFCENILK